MARVVGALLVPTSAAERVAEGRGDVGAAVVGTPAAVDARARLGAVPPCAAPAGAEEEGGIPSNCWRDSKGSLSVAAPPSVRRVDVKPRKPWPGIGTVGDCGVPAAGDVSAAPVRAAAPSGRSPSLPAGISRSGLTARALGEGGSAADGVGDAAGAAADANGSRRVDEAGDGSAGTGAAAVGADEGAGAEVWAGVGTDEGAAGPPGGVGPGLIKRGGGSTGPGRGGALDAPRAPASCKPMTRIALGEEPAHVELRVRLRTGSRTTTLDCRRSTKLLVSVPGSRVRLICSGPMR